MNSFCSTWFKKNWKKKWPAMLKLIWSFVKLLFCCYLTSLFLCEMGNEAVWCVRLRLHLSRPVNNQGRWESRCWPPPFTSRAQKNLTLVERGTVKRTYDRGLIIWSWIQARRCTCASDRSSMCERVWGLRQLCPCPRPPPRPPGQRIDPPPSALPPKWTFPLQL